MRLLHVLDVEQSENSDRHGGTGVRENRPWGQRLPSESPATRHYLSKLPTFMPWRPSQPCSQTVYCTVYCTSVVVSACNTDVPRPWVMRGLHYTVLGTDEPSALVDIASSCGGGRAVPLGWVATLQLQLVLDVLAGVQPPTHNIEGAFCRFDASHCGGCNHWLPEG